MPRVLNFGSLNVDHVYRVPHLVRPGETLASTAYTRFAGGKGFNQSIALARAGAQVSHAGCLGADGRWLRDQLAADGINVSRVREVAAPTGHALIQVADDGENAIVLFPGANLAPSPTEALAALEGFGPGDWLLCQNETAAVPDLLTAARARGLTVCLNPAPMTAAVRDWPLDVVDWLIVNETEGTALSGETTPDRIVAALRARLPHSAIVLSLGAAGAVCAHRGEIHCATAPCVQVIDTTAAGDTLIGYLIAALLAGRPEPVALARACRAGALCVTRAGAAASVPRAGEVDAFTG